MYNKIKTHSFNFAGGDLLSKIGASWFISYSYYLHIDNSHLNWQNCKTTHYRTNIFNKTKKYHNLWLQEVVKMNELNLSTNNLGLNGTLVIKLAKSIINCCD